MKLERRKTIQSSTALCDAFGIQKILIGPVRRFSLVQPGIIRQAQFHFRLTVEKRQAGIARAFRDGSNLMQGPAGKDDCAARRGAIGPPPKLRKDQVTALVATIQIQGHGKAAMLGSSVQVVPVAAKKPANLAVV